MTTRIYYVEFGYNVDSADVVAHNIALAMKKARDLLVSKARKENREKDAVFLSKLPITEVKLIAESDN